MDVCALGRARAQTPPGQARGQEPSHVAGWLSHSQIGCIGGSRVIEGHACHQLPRFPWFG